LERSY